MELQYSNVVLEEVAQQNVAIQGWSINVWIQSLYTDKCEFIYRYKYPINKTVI